MLNTQSPEAERSMSKPLAVDNTDWLKTVAIMFVLVDHFGYFFMDDDRWWGVFGRMAAPPFFFLMGYARSRTVPLRWLWLGTILTLLDSWNNGWTWVAPNILLSFAVIRLVLPYVRTLLLRNGWVAFAILVAVLIAVTPPTAKIVDYGAEGWLWALFGLCQRMYVDGKSASDVSGPTQQPSLPSHAATRNPGLMPLLACVIAAVIYTWQEQNEFEFSQIQLAVFILCLGILGIVLWRFRRGPSRIQPPPPIAAVLRFIGRHTLEIYAIELAGFELIIKVMPDLAP